MSTSPKRQPSRWKRLRYRLETLFLRGLIALCSWMPRRVLHWTAKGIGNLAFLLDRRGRSTALANLAVIFPESRVSRRRRIARLSYEYFVIGMLDLFWAPRHLRAENSRHFVCHEYLDAEGFAKLRDGPVIFVTPHYGTFEWLSFEWALHHGKVMIVAEDFKNPALTPIFTRLREHSGIKIIGQDRAMVRLLRHVRDGGRTAFLTDLTVPPNKAAAIIECFGLKTCVTIMHAFLAKQTNAPIVPVICLPQPTGGYVFRFYPAYRPEAGVSLREITQHCWDVFEQEIRSHPEPWLWMYKHWRHLPGNKEQASRYPAYSRHSVKFATLEQEVAP